MAFTLALNNKWDIFADESGNIATATSDYAIAQNCANAVRLFTNDAYFDKNRGIPHFDIELGHKPQPSQSTLINRIKKAVMNVNGVLDCEVSLEFEKPSRTYTGEIYITTHNNTTVRIEL